MKTIKERYIKRVKRELRLPRRKKEEVARDLEEIFSSAMEHGETEEKVIERLGAPKEFADGAAEQFGVDNKRKRIIKRGIAAAAAAAVLIAAAAIEAPAIFQRGNPIPYLAAAAKITDETPYVQVKTSGGSSVYISRRGKCPELFKYVEESRNVEFAEQAGSGYIFSNGADSLVISSEIYLGKYTVWQMPDKTLACNENSGTAR